MHSLHHTARAHIQPNTEILWRNMRERAGRRKKMEMKFNFFLCSFRIFPWMLKFIFKQGNNFGVFFPPSGSNAAFPNSRLLVIMSIACGAWIYSYSTRHADDETIHKYVDNKCYSKRWIEQICAVHILLKPVTTSNVNSLMVSSYFWSE